MSVVRMSVVLVSAGVVLVNAGCGGRSSSAPSTSSGTESVTEPATGAGPQGQESAYERQMNDAGRDVSAALGSLAKVTALSLRYPVRPTAAKKAASILAKAQGDLRDAGKEIDAVTPPAEIRRGHAQLAKGVAELRTELTPLIKKLRRGYLVVASKLPSLGGAAQIHRALASLKKHGYGIGGGR